MSQNLNSQENAGQMQLDLRVITSKEVDGIEMGVLNDGTPFLTGRGLSRFCGVSNSTLVEWGEVTPDLNDSLRSGKMAELLAANGFDGACFFTRVPVGIQFGVENSINAYPDSVCNAFLEYYAFEAGRHCTQKAKDNFRKLARKSLRDYIYHMTGYDPLKQIHRSWRHFHDRLLLNRVPASFFSAFSETSQLVLTSIQEGLIIDDHTVPDISVGKLWSDYWIENDLSKDHGVRRKHPHIYPDYFPQAQANGSIDAYIYPLSALGLFRGWLQTEYLPRKFPKYLKRKASQGAISPSQVLKLLQAVEPLCLKAAS